MTLIEVICGLVILGTVLVTVLVARAGHLQQWRKAKLRGDAVLQADELLRQWKPESFPLNKNGDLTAWHWQTRTLNLYEHSKSLAILGTQIVRLELSPRQKPQEVVLSIDIMIPTPHTENQEATP